MVHVSRGFENPPSTFYWALLRENLHTINKQVGFVLVRAIASLCLPYVSTKYKQA